jgi:alkanesulfonate monooxygenase SsuD/methylene tetrahydromethanopterin reductase-like flavin-dependent oxidoreductase (luciferase family)
MRLGTAISSVFVRTAPTIAMAAACVDHFSNGRFVLGLLSSHKVQVEVEHGVHYTEPVTRVRETVEVVRALLRDGAVSFRGKTITIKHFNLWFKPAHTSVPIYLSALFPQMLGLCGEIAQGLLMVFSTLGSARAAAEHLSAGAARAGRNVKEIEIASLVPASVAPDRKTAYDRVRPSRRNGGGVDRFRHRGRPARANRRVSALRDRVANPDAGAERSGFDGGRSRDVARGRRLTLPLKREWLGIRPARSARSCRRIRA